LTLCIESTLIGINIETHFSLLEMKGLELIGTHK
jgi:hypothetical protein